MFLSFLLFIQVEYFNDVVFLFLPQAQGYPAGYLGYPAYSPMQAYYPSLAYTYPGIQQAQMRQTIMVPVSQEICITLAKLVVPAC